MFILFLLSFAGSLFVFALYTSFNYCIASLAAPIVISRCIAFTNLARFSPRLSSLLFIRWASWKKKRRCSTFSVSFDRSPPFFMFRLHRCPRSRQRSADCKGFSQDLQGIHLLLRNYVGSTQTIMLAYQVVGDADTSKQDKIEAVQKVCELDIELEVCHLFYSLPLSRPSFFVVWLDQWLVSFAADEAEACRLPEEKLKLVRWYLIAATYLIFKLRYHQNLQSKVNVLLSEFRSLRSNVGNNSWNSSSLSNFSRKLQRCVSDSPWCYRRHEGIHGTRFVLFL